MRALGAIYKPPIFEESRRTSKPRYSESFAKPRAPTAASVLSRHFRV